MTAKARTDLSQYLQEIGRYPLLTREQEVELGRRARNGDLEARNLLICSNARLVVKFAKKYCGSTLEMADLIGEGNRGLIKAVTAFDPERGVRFATYAVGWIKQCIHNAIKERHLIHLPHYLQHRIRAGKTARTNPDVVTAATRVLEMRDASNDGSRDYSEPFLMTIPDNRESQPDEAAEVDDRVEVLRDLLSLLDDRERHVVVQRVVEGKKLIEIADEFGLSKERVRQIQVSAFRKMRKAYLERIKAGRLAVG